MVDIIQLFPDFADRFSFWLLCTSTVLNFRDGLSNQNVLRCCGTAALLDDSLSDSANLVWKVPISF